MKQVVQNFKTGELSVQEVPTPSVRAGGVLVRTINSLVSAGTERMTAELGKKTLLGKAMDRPDLVKKVFDKVKRDGILEAFQSAASRLESPLPLGYSSSGVIIEIGEGVGEFHIGDRVACAGMGYASHAEVAFIPKNLMVKIPESVSFEEAAFTTIGAIAMQGVRAAQVSIGETVAVIGLGLVGLITVQILKAAGCRVLGSDLLESRLKLALELGADEVAPSDGLCSQAEIFSQHRGLDAVIITADTASDGPIQQAGEIAREKGRIVVVGTVGMTIPRRVYYEKELSLQVSCSYGPGRYDPVFEEKGIDYPIGYVRWTETRNMESFVELLSNQKVNVRKLITHRFPIGGATKAYDLLIRGAAEPYLGILFGYGDGPADASRSTRVQLTSSSPSSMASLDTVNLGVIGAGNFSRSVLLPALKRLDGITLKSIVSASGLSAHALGRKYRFEECATDYQQILKDPTIDAVMIVTRHNLHAPLVMDALQAGKDVFVEKPLCLSEDELEKITELHRSLETASKPSVLMVGFNRRFSPLINKAKEFFAGHSSPLTIHYRINAGLLPKDSWINDPVEGGGRIRGEVCHFADLIQYLVGADPVQVYAQAIDDETVVATLQFSDGSIGTVHYVSSGDPTFPKERLEIIGGGRIAIMEDFRKLTLSDRGRKIVHRKFVRDKGHPGELEAFIRAVRTRGESPVPFREARLTTLATLKILESLNTGRPVSLKPFMNSRHEPV